MNTAGLRHPIPQPLRGRGGDGMTQSWQQSYARIEAQAERNYVRSRRIQKLAIERAILSLQTELRQLEEDKELEIADWTEFCLMQYVEIDSTPVDPIFRRCHNRIKTANLRQIKIFEQALSRLMRQTRLSHLDDPALQRVYKVMRTLTEEADVMQAKYGHLDFSQCGKWSGNQDCFSLPLAAYAFLSALSKDCSLQECRDRANAEANFSAQRRKERDNNCHSWRPDNWLDGYINHWQLRIEQAILGQPDQPSGWHKLATY